jgi:hypothetical protein
VAKYLLWAFAGTIDKIATATLATKSNAAFMAISSQIPPVVGGKQLYLRLREETELIHNTGRESPTCSGARRPSPRAGACAHPVGYCSKFRTRPRLKARRVLLPILRTDCAIYLTRSKAASVGGLFR